MGKIKETHDDVRRQVLSAYSVKTPAIFAAICFFIGTVFTFGMWYCGETINKSEAISDTAIFESYKINRGNVLKDGPYSAIRTHHTAPSQSTTSLTEQEGLQRLHQISDKHVLANQKHQHAQHEDS